MLCPLAMTALRFQPTRLALLALAALVGSASSTPASADDPEGTASTAIDLYPDETLRWVVVDDDSPITREDETRAHRGKLLLATGIPPLAMSTFPLAFGIIGTRDDCYSSSVTMAPSLVTGALLAAVGAGLTFGGAGLLSRSSRDARKAKRSKRARIRLGLATATSTLLSMGFAAAVTGVNSASCFSS